MKIHNNGYWRDDERKIPHVVCEPLCDWIAHYLIEQNEYLYDQRDKELYDFGCGNGGYCKRLTEAGFKNVIGFEGCPNFTDYDNIVKQDLTEPFVLPVKGNVLCLEVAEHVPAIYEDIFLNNIVANCDSNLILSWSEPLQGGTGHFNEVSNAEAIYKIVKRGFRYFHTTTMEARKAVKDSEFWWFKNTVMVFKRKL